MCVSPLTKFLQTSINVLISFVFCRSGFSPKVMRELSLLSHLGNCQPPHLSALLVNELQPYW